MELKFDQKNFCKSLIIIVLVCGFVGGIICGNICPKLKFDMSSAKTSFSTSDVVSTFNTALMIYIWIGSALFAALLNIFNIIIHALHLFIFKFYGTSDLDAIDAIYEKTLNQTESTSSEQ